MTNTADTKTKTAKTESVETKGKALSISPELAKAVETINTEFVNSTKAADIIGVTKATLTNWKGAKGKLQPAFKIDRTAFYDKNKVEQLAAARKALAEIVGE